MGQVVHFELSVPRPEEAAAFYAAVFGWSAQKLPDPVRYWQLRPSAEGGARGIPGGIVQSKTGAARVSITNRCPFSAPNRKWSASEAAGFASLNRRPLTETGTVIGCAFATVSFGPVSSRTGRVLAATFIVTRSSAVRLPNRLLSS